MYKDITSKQLIRYESDKKSVAIAYLFYFIVGFWTQFHRLYAGNKIIALVLFLAPIIGFYLISSIEDSSQNVGAIIFFLWGIVGIFDLVYIPFMVKKRNMSILEKIISEE